MLRLLMLMTLKACLVQVCAYGFYRLYVFDGVLRVDVGGCLTLFVVLCLHFFFDCVLDLVFFLNGAETAYGAATVARQRIAMFFKRFGLDFVMMMVEFDAASIQRRDRRHGRREQGRRVTAGAAAAAAASTPRRR